MSNGGETPVSNPRGVTLVELIVTIAILGILAAILLPAVMSVREASRRTQCVSNLRQIGIALHSYEAVHRALPPGASTGSFHVAILPFTEQGALHEATEAAFAERHRCCGQFPAPPLAICPSDSMGGFGRTSYAANMGTGVQRHGFNGVFRFLDGWDPWPGGVIRLRDVTDGTSQTAAVSEMLSGDVEESDRRRLLWHLQERLGGAGQMRQLISQCMMAADVTIADPVAGIWWSGNPGHTLYNHVLTPNQTSCVSQGYWVTGIFTAASEHPGGVNMLFVDGHVQFISSDVDSDAWIGLGSRSGGEPTPRF